MDFIWAILFLLWYEVLGLPLRWAIAGWSAPPDVRRMLSRLAGPVLLALPVWFASHGQATLLGRPASLAWLGLTLAAGLLWGLRQTRSLARLMAYESGLPTIDGPQLQNPHSAIQVRRPGGPSRPHSHWRRQAALDLMMAALVLAFVAFRRWVPEMIPTQLDGSGAEKFANSMIFWATWNARHLPPDDAWFSGNTLNYYYWGHFQWAWAARLGGFPPLLALNLTYAVAVTWVWTAAYLLARAARLPLGWAAGAALCVTWAGNPDALVRARPLLQTWLNTHGQIPWGGYDYWGPSRAIPNVVDEFPAFSAILGDYHSHHLALPWFTGWLALAVAGRRWAGARLGGNAVLAALAWVALGTAAVLTNLWNMPLIGFGLCLMLVLALRRGWRGFALQFALSLLLGGLLLYGMHLLRGDAPLPLPSAEAKTFWDRLPFRILPAELRTPPANLWGMWGFPVLVLAIGAAANLVRRNGSSAGIRAGISKLPCEGVPASSPASGRAPARARARNRKPASATQSISAAAPVAASPAPTDSPSFRIPRSAFRASLILVAVGALLALVQLTPLGVRIPLGIAWFWVGMGLLVFSLTLGRRPWLGRPMAAALIAACVVLAGLELAYLPDRFVGELVRYNSYFKFSYPVWPVLWVGAWVVARGLWRARLALPVALGVRLALLAVPLLAAVYTVCAMPARIAMSSYGDAPPRRPTLDAYNFVAHRPQVAAEAPLLDWIRRNVPTFDRVAEGAWHPSSTEAPAYKYQGRIASLAAHSIPIGWEHHEQQWRGPTAFEPLDRRVAQVNALYEAPTPELLRRRAADLGVRWIVYGVNEAALYGPAALARLQAALRPAAAFPAGAPTVFIFECKPNSIK